MSKQYTKIQNAVSYYYIINLEYMRKNFG